MQCHGVRLWSSSGRLSGGLAATFQNSCGVLCSLANQLEACHFSTSTNSSSSSSQESGLSSTPAAAPVTPPPKSTSTSSTTSATASSSSSSSIQPSSSSSPAPAPSTSAAAAEPHYLSRTYQFYQNHLSRELLLKLNVRNVHQLPKVKTVIAHINARDLYPEKEFVDKWQMLLPALALEYITGQPAQYSRSTHKYYRARNVVAGVNVKLHGAEGHDFLEKLAYLVLPSQNAFDGILMRQLDSAGTLHFRIPNMINFPDFEEMFEIFEALRSLHVTVVMQNVSKRPHRSQLLMTGLQMPLLRKRKLVGQPDEAFADGQDTAAGQKGK